jgi:hypothetical protein
MPADLTNYPPDRLKLLAALGYAEAKEFLGSPIVAQRPLVLNLAAIRLDPGNTDWRWWKQLIRSAGRVAAARLAVSCALISLSGRPDEWLSRMTSNLAAVHRWSLEPSESNLTRVMRCENLPEEFDRASREPIDYQTRSAVAAVNAALRTTHDPQFEHACRGAIWSSYLSTVAPLFGSMSEAQFFDASLDNIRHTLIPWALGDGVDPWPNLTSALTEHKE